MASVSEYCLRENPAMKTHSSFESYSSSASYLAPCDIDFIERDSEEAKEVFDTEHRFNELLRGLSGCKATCNWGTPYNDMKVRQHFRVQWQEVDTSELLNEYFFDGQSDSLELCLADPEVKNDMDYFLYAIPFDTNEEALFFSQDPRADGADRKAVKRCAQSISSAVNFLRDKRKTQSHISDQMTGGVRLWLKYLEHLIQQDQTRLLEQEYVQNFQMMLQCFGLINMKGCIERLKFPETKMRCNPDLVVGNVFTFVPSQRDNLVPVAAKRIIQDPTFSKYGYLWKKPKKSNLRMRISSQQDEEGSYSFGDLDSDSDSDSDSDAHSDDTVILKDASPDDGGTLKKAAEAGDSPPRKFKKVTFSYTQPSENKHRNVVFTFLSQLLAQIASLDYKYPSPNHKRIGIGLVGFRVMFVVFHGKPGVQIHQVPMTKGATTEVRVTRPLCLLNATDLKEIATVLSVMSQNV